MSSVVELLDRSVPAPPSEATVLLAILLLLVFVVVLVTLVGARRRAELEALRQGELTQRNAELEALRRSLEERVAARTAELEASNRQLEVSHRALAATCTELQRNQEGLIAAERMAAIGRLTAGVAHEMSSPLSATLCSLSELSELVEEHRGSIGDERIEEHDLRELNAEMQAALSLAQRGIDRAMAYLRGIKSHAREGDTRREAFDAAHAVEESLLLLAPAARAARCELRFEAPPHAIMLHGAAARLMQVITNLTANALDATADRGGGEVKLHLARRDDHVLLAVADGGGGIADDVLPRIFEPMFTTKPHGKGTGLGLSIADDIVRNEFEGGIAVRVDPGRGTTFELRLPGRAEV
jgi:C4-dicarboxylate-specific signal transduction histidine kinase